MDATRDHDRRIIMNLLKEYAAIPHVYGEVTCLPVFDTAGDHYLLMNIGWDKDRRVHYCSIHIDIIGDKIWLQRDNTDAVIAQELVRAGIPRSRIVLGFRPSKVRPLIEGFAVA
jgi:hypothetical protein